ncbi:MAG: hypothetical protein ACPGCS_00325 [Opitutales bacterium]
MSHLSPRRPQQTAHDVVDRVANGLQFLRACLPVLGEPMQKKKKVDYEALNSSLMRIPRMDVATARNLIDIGIQDIYELQGRAPEVLFEEALSKAESLPPDRIRYFRMAVYYAEHPDPEPSKLHPDAWIQA